MNYKLQETNQSRRFIDFLSNVEVNNSIQYIRHNTITFGLRESLLSIDSRHLVYKELFEQGLYENVDTGLLLSLLIKIPVCYSNLLTTQLSYHIGSNLLQFIKRYNRLVEVGVKFPPHKVVYWISELTKLWPSRYKVKLSKELCDIMCSTLCNMMHDSKRGVSIIYKTMSEVGRYGTPYQFVSTLTETFIKYK